MLRTFFRWLAALFLAGIYSMPVQAQAPPSEPEKERRPPAPEYMLAGIAVALVLVIVCMPSRK